MDQNFGYGAKQSNRLEDDSDSSEQYYQEELLDQKQDRKVVDPMNEKFEKTPHEGPANWGDEDSYSPDENTPSEDENTPSEEGPDEDP